MSQLDLSYYGLKELPRFGKDHLALADWRLSVPHQRRNVGGGESPAAVAYEFDHSGDKKRVSLEGGATIGLPTDADDLFLIGLLTLAAGQEFPAKLHFEPSHVLQVLRLPVRDRHIARQRKAYERFVALTAMFEGAWFDRKAKSARGDFITGILAEVYYEPRRGRRRKGEQPASYVQFTNNFHESVLRGNLINIDLELLATWNSPTAALLYRHLNKVWHHGRKPKLYSRDLKEMACGHLQMTDGKNLKENFSKVLQELEKNSYLSPMAKQERFESIRRGVWRVHFEIHPDRVAKSKQVAMPSSNEAKRLVEHYAKLRHSHQDYQPEKHELDRADALISEFGLDATMKVTVQVAEAVKRQNQSDVYFGFAVAYYKKLLQRQIQIEAKSNNQQKLNQLADVHAQRIEHQSRQREQLYQQRMQIWKQSDVSERKLPIERALTKATSETVRDHILSSTLDNPAPEVLREINIPPTNHA
ncbi:MAG: hypothetical protein MI725_05180 [Pirellulales bacterium]|nr:hypothetical protein [Pirellulales bacterium]